MTRSPAKKSKSTVNKKKSDKDSQSKGIKDDVSKTVDDNKVIADKDVAASSSRIGDEFKKINGVYVLAELYKLQKNPKFTIMAVEAPVATTIDDEEVMTQFAVFHISKFSRCAVCVCILNHMTVLFIIVLV